MTARKEASVRTSEARRDQYRRLLGAGLTQDQIAKRLSVNPETVRAYMRAHPDLKAPIRVEHDTRTYACAVEREFASSRHGLNFVSLPREPWVSK